MIQISQNFGFQLSQGPKIEYFCNRNDVQEDNNYTKHGKLISHVKKIEDIAQTDNLISQYFASNYSAMKKLPNQYAKVFYII